MEGHGGEGALATLAQSSPADHGPHPRSLLHLRRARAGATGARQLEGQQAVEELASTGRRPGCLDHPASWEP